MTWEKLVEREGDFLKNYLLYESFVENFPAAHNQQHSDFMTIRKGDTFTHFVHKPSAKEFSKLLRDNISQNPQLMNEMSEKGALHFRNLLHFSEETRNHDLKKLSNPEMKELIAEYFKLYKTPYPYFNITIFTDELEEKAEIVDVMANLRLLGRSSFNKTHELIEPVFEEVGKRFCLDVKEIKFLKPIEILGLLDGDQLEVKNLISKRQTCSFIFQEGKFVLKENESCVITEEATEEKEEEEEEEEEMNIELKGRGTFPSLYTGKVKIVRTLEDIKQMEQGDILVSRMTTPDLIAEGMRKAGAIITDEGGVTCHAAVLSRELNIPALLGTGNATTVLKNGDVVEIDTYKGIAVKLQPNIT